MKYEVKRERSSHRVPMIPHEPAYLLCSVSGINIDPVVEELGGAGARLVCPAHFDLFREGQLIGPCVLVLQDEGMPIVYPVVKWKFWPLIGVEFSKMAEKERQMIVRFMNNVERRKRDKK